MDKNWRMDMYVAFLNSPHGDEDVTCFYDFFDRFYKLSKRYQKVMKFRYKEDLTFKEIGNRIPKKINKHKWAEGQTITESRAQQIHNLIFRTIARGFNDQLYEGII
jgi:hypothetical protein